MEKDIGTNRAANLNPSPKLIITGVFIVLIFHYSLEFLKCNKIINIHTGIFNSLSLFIYSKSITSKPFDNAILCVICPFPVADLEGTLL
jgi:hypothetical protein